MQRLVGILLFLTFSYVRTSPTKTISRTVRSYCDISDDVSLIRFNFTGLSIPGNDLTIEDEKSGDSIRLQLCSPLHQKCDDMEGYRVCLTKNKKEIGLGREAPAPIGPSSGALEFVFLGETCRGDEKYSVHVIMKCKNEDGYDTLPKMIPRNPDDCKYFMVWETKAACGPENTVNCTAIGSAGEHYDLRPLMLPSENYIIPMSDSSQSEIILNVCHSVVFEHDIRCPIPSGACLREIGKDQQYKYSNLGEVHEPLKFDKNSKELSLTYVTGGICPNIALATPHVETIITFTCDYHASNTLPVYMGGGEECRHRFTWRTDAACSIESLKNQSIATAGACIVTNPITNIEYNLRSLMNKDFHSKMKNGMEYNFRVCSSITDGSCPSGTGACIVKKKISTGSANTNLTWSQGGPYLNYTNGAECGKNQRRYTLIAFFCGAEGSTSEPIIMENENCSLIIHWNTPLVCEKRITCGTRYGEINLASLTQWSKNYVVKANDTEFHINICRPLVPKPYLTCLHGSSACRVIPEANGQFSNETSLGYPDEKPFFDDKKNVILRYTGGSSCPEDSKTKLSSNLTFLCNYTAAVGTPRYKRYENCTHVFEWTTSIVCETAEGKWEKGCTIVNPRLSHRINLAPLSKKSVYSVPSQTGDEYKISICDGDNYCKGSTVCKGNVGYGTSSLVIFDYNRNVIKLKFTNSTRCNTGQYSSEIHFICDESSGIGQPTLILEDFQSSCNAVFEWKTAVVCVNHKSNEVSIDGEPRVAETMENIKEAANEHVGTTVGIALFIASCVALIIYLWSSERRERLRFCFKSLTSRREHCRAKYTKVDATEEARLLLDIEDTTQCLTDSNSDDELLDA